MTFRWIVVAEGLQHPAARTTSARLQFVRRNRKHCRFSEVVTCVPSPAGSRTYCFATIRERNGRRVPAENGRDERRNFMQGSTCRCRQRMFAWWTATITSSRKRHSRPIRTRSNPGKMGNPPQARRPGSVLVQRLAVHGAFRKGPRRDLPREPARQGGAERDAEQDRP